MLLYKEMTDKIIKCFYNVYNELGHGFLEAIYENSLVILLREEGLKVEQQKDLVVKFRNIIVGKYMTDLIVNDKIILELKAAKKIAPEHEAQLLNYLKATNMELGLLLNFGIKPEFKRFIFSSNQ
ncbi:MAG TPA: GxxExxY protein [Candidatus Marinimicrobia bacterium]|nr:GxxExxY protein [Candidatus Neomarinimicrobiota bacterium]